MNYVLFISFGAMAFAQIVKLFTVYFAEKKWDLGVLISTGGMPSSHTTLVTTLAVSIALVDGVFTDLFAVAAVYAFVVIHDSMGIRYEAGKHASILNELVGDFKTSLSKENEPKNKLKELLGHKPIEVVVGLGLGLVISLLGFYILYPFFK